VLIAGGCVLVMGVAAWRQSPDASSATAPAPLQLIAPANAADVRSMPAERRATSATTNKAPGVKSVAKRPFNGETPDDYVYVPPTSRGAAAKSPALRSAPRGKAVVETSAAPRLTTSAASPAYDRAVSDAATLADEDRDRAARRLEAIAADAPGRPEAFETLAGIRLKQGDYHQAYEMYESAIRQGGKATFSILHDHTRGNFDSGPKNTCAGELSIQPSGVKFEGADGHRFASTWAELQEAGANKFFGSGIGGFHVKVTIGEGKSRNFNLAPRSKDKREANLILDLLIENARRVDSGR
jgi:hypothetical protein